MPQPDAVAEAQSESLDDTDCYASVWNEILTRQREEDDSFRSTSLWGGRGKGGRGLARRTVQPKDIVVDNVRLQYLLGDVCLEGATIKLLQNHVYALVGRNGCGKSTLLQRMNAQKIPGWSTQWTTLYIPPELPSCYLSMTPLEVIFHYQNQTHQHSVAAMQLGIDELEERLDALNVEDEQEEIERVCEELSKLEEQMQSDQSSVEQQARDALSSMEIADVATCGDLSRGQQKRLLLSIGWVCSSINLLLLDEPANDLDTFGLIQLRQLIESSTSTVLMISHDLDLINDVATDIIDMQCQKLLYYPGNYDSYRLMKHQQGMHELRQSVALEKKRGQLKSTLQQLKAQPVPKRGGAKKKAKAVASQRKKLERHTKIEKQINASAAQPIRRGLTAAQRLKLAETTKDVPHKAVQFVFRQRTCTWGEPLITLLDVGHSYDKEAMETNLDIAINDADGFKMVKRQGFLFDCVDLCIEEGSRNCIFGPTASGKSSLLRILAKKMPPLEGEVHHATGLRVGYFDPEVISEIVASTPATTTALEYLTDKYPEKIEQDLRGYLAAFGLPPVAQAKTSICHLSGGEKCRFVLATIMIDDPPVLCMDDPTSHLDVESVQALIYGLRQWDGTLVLVSQDANFLRSLENVKCFVVMPDEAKLRCVEGGMDAYLKSFRM